MTTWLTLASLAGLAGFPRTAWLLVGLAAAAAWRHA